MMELNYIMMFGNDIQRLLRVKEMMEGYIGPDDEPRLHFQLMRKVAYAQFRPKEDGYFYPYVILLDLPGSIEEYKLQITYLLKKFNPRLIIALKEGKGGEGRRGMHQAAYRYRNHRVAMVKESEFPEFIHGKIREFFKQQLPTEKQLAESWENDRKQCMEE